MQFEITGNNYKQNALPSYNDYITQCRSNKFGANAWKKKFQEIIARQMNSQGVKFFINSPFSIDLTIIESSKRRDKDNVEAMAKKLILDTLQAYGFISNDKLYEGGTTRFIYDKESKIIINIKEET